MNAPSNALPNAQLIEQPTGHLTEHATQYPQALARILEQVRVASANKTPLDIRGGATKSFYGEAGRPAQVLDLRELSGISSYEPSELVITARAGTPLADLEAALAERGQCLAFEPPHFAPGGTVGGMVAAGLAGPARASVGSVRDYILGATLVNGRAELLSFGGQVMKNVAGYDISRLLAGSMGVLGVICELSIKVLPTAPASATRVFELGQATALARLQNWSAQPWPLNASVWHEGRLFVRWRGAQAAVRAACTQWGGEPLADEAAWWQSVRDHRHPFFKAGGDDHTHLWRLSLPDASPILALEGETFIEWGGALRWCWTEAGATHAAHVRQLAAQVGGHATLFRATDKSAGVFSPLPEPTMNLQRRIKQAFDPEGIFNPGRLYAGL